MVTMQDAIILARATKRALRKLQEFHCMGLEDLDLADLLEQAEAFLEAAGEGEPT